MKNITDSVKARLKNIADARKLTFDFICLIYFQERLLYRLSISKYKDNFILKGGFMLHFLNASEFRPTKDIDFLGSKINNDPDNLKKIFKEICDAELDDGLKFDTDSIETAVIKEGADYEGTRLKLIAHLGSVRIRMTIDIGFGDTILSGPVKKEYTGMLNMGDAILYTYPFETVIAEKFEAIVQLNYLTSRMKDFYDIHFIASNQVFDIGVLLESITATFKKRSTKMNLIEVVFSNEFKSDKSKEIQWQAFVKRDKLCIKLYFAEIVEEIEIFLKPVINVKNIDLKWNPEKWIWE
ncbi:MAG: nucleotidyl transferase AbiEii/AbiGii toxin family protein [Candidatus Delongbacteria bacterium]|jgi:predicted nucleotidyltransferase component of viral defense system|nr:nucleotidyl transferase AbiEii/AbiGii toxin family protein [Candidatus Delongbacteria bacterium]MDD4205772.1 nucleotidyl transferase AbiEii/AbiGii toxin family protein [Candidatus Delongbacteria bacterium]